MRDGSLFAKNFLFAVVFLCGAVVMALELVGSRVLAPYAGNNILVWTSLIGIILGSMSCGYWWGGKLADKYPTFRALSVLVLLASIAVGAIGFFYPSVLAALAMVSANIIFIAISGTLIFFALPSLLLGMVSPYAARLTISEIQTSGAIVGSLYAISTFGSIVGTFAGGFFILSFFGTTRSLFLLALALAVCALFLLFAEILIRKEKVLSKNILFSAAIMFLLSFALIAPSPAKENLIADIDSPHQRILVYETKDYYSGRPIRALSTDIYGRQSAIFLDEKEGENLVLPYTRFFRLGDFFTEYPGKALMIGGGAYSYPKEFIERHPQAVIDVVEIDPKITEMAKKYFELQDNPRLKIFHEDGRIFLKNSDEMYDVIFVDAFNGTAIPRHLVTREMVALISEHLNDKGSVVVNIISSIEGPQGKLFRAIYSTYASVFPRVFVFQVSPEADAAVVQNLILIAAKYRDVPDFSTAQKELSGYLAYNYYRKFISQDMPVLTDEFAPLEFYEAALRL